MHVQKEEAILAQRLDDASAKGRLEGILIGEERGIKIGEEKGEPQAKIAMAKNLLSAGVSTDIISQTTGLSFDEIKQLQAEKTT